MTRTDRIYLSPPATNEQDRLAVEKTLDSGWVAPVGPQLDQFEQCLGDFFPDRSVLAVNSGTAALHLSLILSGVERNDRVLVSSFTFAACANVILYQGAIPVFMDSEGDTWNLDPSLLEEYLSAQHVMPKAIIVTHLYGIAAQIQQIITIAKKYGVIVIEDAAEALGSKSGEKFLGGWSDFGILSFNGNKIVTTGGGGALICSKEDYEKALHLSTQANTAKYGYHHDRVGYNYRLSNVLAGLGVSQLGRLQEFMARKREIFQCYRDALSKLLRFPDWDADTCNHWLTVAQLAGKERSIENLITFLDKQNIESRQLWKPLHLHPAYSAYSFYGSGVCEEVFKTGLCLPSGVGMSKSEQKEVIAAIKEFFHR